MNKCCLFYEPWLLIGLVYFHFGKEIISTLQKSDIKDPLVEKLFVKVGNDSLTS